MHPRQSIAFPRTHHFLYHVGRPGHDTNGVTSYNVVSASLEVKTADRNAVGLSAGHVFHKDNKVDIHRLAQAEWHPWPLIAKTTRVREGGQTAGVKLYVEYGYINLAM